MLSIGGVVVVDETAKINSQVDINPNLGEQPVQLLKVAVKVAICVSDVNVLSQIEIFGGEIEGYLRLINVTKSVHVEGS